MLNPIKEIVRFNREAGLIDQGYDDFRESSYQIEEALEGFNLRWLIRDLHDDDLMDDANAKQVSRSIMQSATEEVIDIPDVDRLDKACDAVVFAVGSMAKLGLNSQEITKALNVVMHKNFEKLGAPKDEFGKQLKPEGWTGPEPELQKILDARSSK
jgi:predicted HAD superfamily Cof-like phosphohydrolase